MRQTNDELIKKGIVLQLMQNKNLNARNINVEVSNGRVILRGTVGSHSDKISASEDTVRVLGVTDVENNLSVKYPEGVSEPVEEKIKVYLMISRLLKMSDS